MPVVLRRDGFRFFFYSNEGNPLEPPHVHVRRADAEAKFWLKPDVALARKNRDNPGTPTFLNPPTKLWDTHFA
jgi:hypothetical protein